MVAAVRRKLVEGETVIHLPGGALTIAWAPGEAIRMSGPATHVFSAEIDTETLG
jgi:diaminopimelate epimerase